MIKFCRIYGTKHYGLRYNMPNTDFFIERISLSRFNREQHERGLKPQSSRMLDGVWTWALVKYNDDPTEGVSSDDDDKNEQGRRLLFGKTKRRDDERGSLIDESGSFDVIYQTVGREPKDQLRPPRLWDNMEIGFAVNFEPSVEDEFL
mmetsp:Transcript_11543/g.18486  ORF Transcript_11543/g.18486 Transcript_11543/m.18486 type:complete len:148 (+) Transcript_11543:2182-2625(+)